MNSKIRKLKTTGILFLFILFLFILAPDVMAQKVAFESLLTESGFEFEQGLGPLFNQIFRIGLTGAAILAVIFIAIGGFQYMTTDAVSGKTEGRERIQNAVFGLLLALMIFLILNTINPDLLKLKPEIRSVPKRDAPTNFFDRFFQNIKGGDGILQTREQQIEAARKKLEVSDKAVGKPVGTGGRLNSADRGSLEREIKRLEDSIREDVRSDDAFEPTNRNLPQE